MGKLRKHLQSSQWFPRPGCLGSGCLQPPVLTAALHPQAESRPQSIPQKPDGGERRSTLEETQASNQWENSPEV